MRERESKWSAVLVKIRYIERKEGIREKEWRGQREKREEGESGVRERESEKVKQSERAGREKRGG